MKKTNKNDCSTIDVKINKIKESSKKMKIQGENFIFVKPQFGNVPTRTGEKQQEKMHLASRYT